MNRADLNAGAGWGFKQIRGCEYTGGSSVVGVGIPTKPWEERRIGKRRRDYRGSLITRSTIISGNFYLLGRALMNIMTCSSPSRSCYLFLPISHSLSHLRGISCRYQPLDDPRRKIVVGREIPRRAIN